MRSFSASRRRLEYLAPVVALLGTAAAAAGEVTETAVYRVRFESTWTARSHPVDFPSNPHFSRLIGGVRYWVFAAGLTNTGVD